ncbi:DUF559 domain-containing protein [Demequina pelophila]|uniref:DUF559 domain-containing protein n=1 Tax=Demequina pelophila TaxID=1638984 RepID=UPI000783E0B1|nr:DUF559 domain-containing protein [Demequina pelophila]
MTHLRSLPDLAPGLTLAEALAREPRAFTFAELAGLATARKARTAIARGEVTRLLPDAYVGAIHRDSFAARVDAALLWAGPAAAVSGSSAMFIWGFLAQPPAQVEIALPHPSHPQTPDWLRLRRVTWDPPVSRVGALTVMGPSHAVILGYGRLPRRDRASALYRAIRTGLVSAAGLQATLESVPRVPERRELVDRLQAAAAGSESYLEEAGLRRVFNTREFSRFIRQHSVVVQGLRFRLDMFDAETLTAVELDGAAYHSSPEQRLRDNQRDALLATVGIQTIRLPYHDVVERPDWCRALVRGVLVSRSGT